MVNSRQVITVSEILQELSRQTKSPKYEDLIIFLVEKVEISGRLFEVYDSENRGGGDICTAKVLFAVVGIFLEAMQKNKSRFDLAATFKIINASLKLLDTLEVESPHETSTVNRWRQAIFDKLASIETIPKPFETVYFSDPSNISHQLKTLPITVLFCEGPIGRSYLAIMKDFGYRPKKIINIIFDKSAEQRKNSKSSIFYKLKIILITVIQRRKMHHWPAYLRNIKTELFLAVREAVCKNFDISYCCYDEAQRNSSLTSYTDDVETILISDFSSRDFVLCLENQLCKRFLYTGGGFIPSALINLSGVTFLHIHPGKLPEMRGADCTYWSWLLNGRSAGSFFFMECGIDDGDVIVSEYLPIAQINDVTHTDDAKTLYRAIFSFYDPWVRSYILRRAIQVTDEFNTFNRHPQNSSLSMNFYFMHEKLQKVALGRFQNST